MFINDAGNFMYGLLGYSEYQDNIDESECANGSSDDDDDIEFPFMIEDYSKNIKGVDHLNQACSYYKTRHSS